MRGVADWRKAIASEVGLVIVSTTNNSLAEISLAAVQAGKHVLVEKPGAGNLPNLSQSSPPPSVRVRS